MELVLGLFFGVQMSCRSSRAFSGNRFRRAWDLAWDLKLGNGFDYRCVSWPSFTCSCENRHL